MPPWIDNAARATVKSTTFFVDQHRESLLEQVSDFGITVRYAFLRSRETRENNKPGEDFLAFHLESGKITFALCDGVSQSFSGAIASQRLGKKLLEWLWMELPKIDLPVSPLDREANLAVVRYASAQLTRVLNEYSTLITEEISRSDLSHMQNELQREVLIERRDKHGTQSNFTCGYLEVPSKAFPFGRMLLFWLGDAKLRRLIGGRDLTSTLTESWNTDERWSSKLGVIGEIHSFMDIPYKVSTIISHSDGLDPFPVEWYQPSLSADVLNNHFQGLWDLPSSDDVSFIEIDMQNVNYPALPVPSSTMSVPAQIVAPVPLKPHANITTTESAPAAIDQPLLSGDQPSVDEHLAQESRKSNVIETLPKHQTKDTRARRRHNRVVIGTSPIVDTQLDKQVESSWIDELRNFFKNLFG